jgi:hypothetical protein
MVDGVNLVQQKSTGPDSFGLDFADKIQREVDQDKHSKPKPIEPLFREELVDTQKKEPEYLKLSTELKRENYIEAFINNPVVTKIFPDIMNWLNISGNALSFVSHAFDFSPALKSFSKTIGSLTTKSFMISTSVINIVERCYAKNFLSAFGYLNDILIAGTVTQDDTYLARGTASGTYNMANSLAMSVKKKNFHSVDDHVSSTIKGFSKFFKNLFSKDLIKNFLNHENGMWAILGGLGANLGALSWLFSGKVQIPTFIRDVAGVMMDIEQLNPGHLREGRKNYFFSGVSLAVGTVADLFTRLTPSYKDLLVPMTFIFDGIGRHLLRLHQNERELKGGLV